MKNFKARLAGILACLLLFIVPLQADAGWNASPLPAASINTVFGDSTYLNPEWMTKKVTITWNGNTWMTGMDAFKDMPVRLTNNNGAIDCTFLNTAVFQSYFSAINASIASMTTTAAVPVFDNGAGSYIRISGTQHMEAVSSMPDWLAQMLHNLILTGQCTDITLELNDSMMTQVLDSGTVSTSSDFVLAGTCTTSFQTSGANRSNNIVVGASRLNNLIVLPGQTVSVSDTILPRTRANGYKEAGVYVNGAHTSGLGGGVCQIATTLYDAALQAEMEIVQRQNHSMIVTYVKPSMDAAIAGTYKDIKIKNNYSTPVYIEGYTSGKKLIFTIYGKDTRPSGRQVEYVSETVGTTNPGEPQMITDNSLAPGAKVKVQSAHTGYRSRLWKVVTVDGVEQERTLLNEDTYNASKAIYRVGPAQAAPVPAPEPQAPATTPETGENNTPEPAQTEPAQTETAHEAVTGENGGPGVVPTTAAQPAGENAGAESPASPAQEEKP